MIVELLFMAAKLQISRKTCVTLRLKRSENYPAFIPPPNYATATQRHT
jgi:hypothetical protein